MFAPDLYVGARTGAGDGHDGDVKVWA
jgi:hypothetical protein